MSKVVLKIHLTSTDLPDDGPNGKVCQEGKVCVCGRLCTHLPKEAMVHRANKKHFINCGEWVRCLRGADSIPNVSVTVERPGAWGGRCPKLILHSLRKGIDWEAPGHWQLHSEWCWPGLLKHVLRECLLRRKDIQSGLQRTVARLCCSQPACVHQL